MIDIVVLPEWSYAGRHHYSVWADGRKIDEFTSKGWITQAQMYDIASGYKEYLAVEPEV